LKVEVESTTIIQSDKNSEIEKNSQIQGKTLGSEEKNVSKKLTPTA
jgi:hypothetical protein